MTDHNEDWGADDNYDTPEELRQRAYEAKKKTALENLANVKNRTGRKLKLLKPKTFVGFQVEIDTLQALDEWRARICPTYTRSDAIRYILAEFLRKNN